MRPGRQVVTSSPRARNVTTAVASPTTTSDVPSAPSICVTFTTFTKTFTPRLSGLMLSTVIHFGFRSITGAATAPAASPLLGFDSACGFAFAPSAASLSRSRCGLTPAAGASGFDGRVCGIEATEFPEPSALCSGLAQITSWLSAGAGQSQAPSGPSPRNSTASSWHSSNASKRQFAPSGRPVKSKIALQKFLPPSNWDSSKCLERPGYEAQNGPKLRSFELSMMGSVCECRKNLQSLQSLVRSCLVATQKVQPSQSRIKVDELHGPISTRQFLHSSTKTCSERSQTSTVQSVRSSRFIWPPGAHTEPGFLTMRAPWRLDTRYGFKLAKPFCKPSVSTPLSPLCSAKKALISVSP
mmetsp:Transcript_79767/g.143973  ORF Transcript_79767/g.143973 Transcript_79767/m.143973 type:complete len:355 (-) Transcript_79767:245-1309(-)